MSEGSLLRISKEEAAIRAAEGADHPPLSGKILDWFLGSMQSGRLKDVARAEEAEAELEAKIAELRRYAGSARREVEYIDYVLGITDTPPGPR